METLNLPEAHIALLTEFDEVSTVGVPLGCVLVKKDNKFGFFSLEKGVLVLPVEYAHPKLWENGLFQISTVSGSRPSRSGLFSFQRGEFVLPMDEWELSLSLDRTHVFAVGRDRHPQTFGVFSLEKRQWRLHHGEGYMLGKPADYYSQKRHVHSGEEFVFIHDVETKKLGFFSPARGFIFKPRYDRIRALSNVAGVFLVEAECSGGKECFVLCGDRSYKAGPAIDVIIEFHEAGFPMFILKTPVGPANPILGGWCLFDAERNVYHSMHSERVFRWGDSYVGSSQRGSTIYNVLTNTSRHVPVALDTPIDAERWLIRDGRRFGAYSLALDATIIPPVFESLVHIHGDFFFARWQGSSLVINLNDGEIQLPLKLGAPPKLEVPILFWQDLMTIMPTDAPST